MTAPIYEINKEYKLLLLLLLSSSEQICAMRYAVISYVYRRTIFEPPCRELNICTEEFFPVVDIRTPMQADR